MIHLVNWETLGQRWPGKGKISARIASGEARLAGDQKSAAEKSNVYL